MILFKLSMMSCDSLTGNHSGYYNLTELVVVQHTNWRVILVKASLVHWN